MPSPCFMRDWADVAAKYGSLVYDRKDVPLEIRAFDITG